MLHHDHNTLCKGPLNLCGGFRHRKKGSGLTLTNPGIFLSGYLGGNTFQLLFVLVVQSAHCVKPHFKTHRNRLFQENMLIKPHQIHFH